MNAIQKNDVIEGKVIDLTHEGHGVIKLDRYPIFVPNALINETIEFKVIKVKKNFAIGKLLEIKEKSEDRVAPPCIYYQKCGGCQLQHMTYQAQLNMKKEQVVNLFHRKAGFKDVVIHDTIGMENPWFYRNKSQVPVGKNNENKVITGFYRQRSHDIIDMDECLIQDNMHQDVLNKVKQWFNELSISVYNERKKQGLMRHVVIRTGHHSRELMVVFVTNGKKFKQSDVIVERLVATFPEIVSVKQNINDTHSNVIMGEHSYTLFGKDEIQDTLSN